MNVTDQWMMQQMQQMAANMAAPPQPGQNADAPRTEKGESFQDLMNKAKDQKADTAQKGDGGKKAENVQKDDGAGRAENVQKEEAAQPGQTVQKTQKTMRIDPRTGLREIDVTPEEAALLVAGYAQLSPPMEDGTVWMVTALDENGVPVLPMAALEETDISLMDGQFSLTEGEWVLDEITPEFTQALEQLLRKTNDPRPAADIIDTLKQKMSEPQLEPEMRITVRPDNGEEKKFDLGAQVMTAGQPLFHDVKAAPVKMGENFQLDTEDPDMDANLADTIRFAVQEGFQQVEIKLSPESLGNLTIKLTQTADGALQVVLQAANPKAASLLNQHLGDLNAALQGHGQSSEVRVEVQRGEDSQQARQDQQQTDPNGHNRQQQEQQRRQESEHSEDFVQRLRLGLFGTEETL